MTLTPEEVDKAVWDLDFEVSKSVRYHAYRRSFWERLDYGAKMLTTVSGTAVLVSIIGDNSMLAKAFAIMVTGASIGDIVFGFSTKARRHDTLYREFSLLAQKMVSSPPSSEDDLRQLRRRRLEIEMEEPGVSDWLERRCAAEECKARGCELRDAWHLSAWQMAFSQWAWWPARP
jgi:hypothetical protein